MMGGAGLVALSVQYLGIFVHQNLKITTFTRTWPGDERCSQYSYMKGNFLGVRSMGCFLSFVIICIII